MSDQKQSRRQFFGASTGLTAAVAAALADPPHAAAQSAGVKKGDLPDLTIKEVKVYVADLSNFRRLNSTETGEIVSVVTNSGHEGNYTIGNRGLTPDWLEWAKPALVGKNVIDLLPAITATTGMKEVFGFSGGRSAAPGGGRGGAGVLLPAAAGGAAWRRRRRHGDEQPRRRHVAEFLHRRGRNLHVGHSRQGRQPPDLQTPRRHQRSRDGLRQFAASAHRRRLRPRCAEAKEQGYKGYKIHPGGGQKKAAPPIPAYIGHMEEIRNIRKAVGDDFVLAHDPVQRYNRFEALKVGRVLDELNYAWFEDPIPTTDLEGLVELNRALDLPLHVGEFLASISDFAEYIRRGALDVARLIADNVGGISGSMRVGVLADAFNLECTPHNWGNPTDLAVHFHLELALPNAYWFEMPHPGDRCGPALPSTSSASTKKATCLRRPSRAWDIRSTATRWTR